MTTRLDKYIQYDGTIYNRYINAAGQVTHANASKELLAIVTTGIWKAHYVWVNKLTFSVYKAAAGGGGICEVRAAIDGDILWTIDVNTTKDFVVDFGEAGVRLSEDLGDGIQIVVSGAGTQASVSVAVEGNYEVPGEN